MFINNITVSKLGIFENISIDFCDDKINIVQGGNGTGKTTFLAVLFSMLQDNEILKYRCDDNKAVIHLKITDGAISVSVKKQYGNNGPEIVVQSFDDMKQLLSVNRDRIYLVSGEFMGHRYKLDGNMINNAKRLLDQSAISNPYTVDFSDSDSSSYGFLSGGIQLYYWTLNLLYHIPENSVLLLDDPFARLDPHCANELLEVMKKLKNIQFIITSGLSKERCMEVYKDCNLSFLAEAGDNTGRNGRLEYDYKKTFGDHIRLLDADTKEKTKGLDGRVIVKYELGKEVDEVECRNVEFKEIKGNNPCNSIIDNAEIYINSFLNSRIAGVGIIKWGISDDGIVRGVELSKKDRDIIDRKISERIGQMKPYVSTDSIQISYEKIVCNNEIVPDLYVIEIVVESVVSDILFSTSKNDIYIKTDGGKRKLDSFELQQELQRRWEQ